MKIIIVIIFFLIIFSYEISALPTSQHLSIAILLSDFVKTEKEALFYGFISHAVTDSIAQEYVFDIFAFNKNTDYIAIEGLLSILLLKRHWGDNIKRMAMIGALAPDIIDGILIACDIDRYGNGDHIFPFHRPNNRKPISKNLTSISSIILFSISYQF